MIARDSGDSLVVAETLGQGVNCCEMAPRDLNRRADLIGGGTAVSTGSATLTISRPVHSIIARRIKALRKARGLTQRQLADRVGVLGVKVDHSRIARVEHDTASLDLSEAIAVAIALEVSLVDLIVPDEPNERVGVTPKMDVDRDQIRVWLVAQDEVDQLVDGIRHRVHELAALRPAYERAAWKEEMIARNPAAIHTPSNYRQRGRQDDHARIRVFLRVEQDLGHLRDAALVLLENPLLPDALLQRLRDAVGTVPHPAGEMGPGGRLPLRVRISLDQLREVVYPRGDAGGASMGVPRSDDQWATMRVLAAELSELVHDPGLAATAPAGAGLVRQALQLLELHDAEGGRQPRP